MTNLAKTLLCLSFSSTIPFITSSQSVERKDSIESTSIFTAGLGIELGGIGGLGSLNLEGYFFPFYTRIGYGNIGYLGGYNPVGIGLIKFIPNQDFGFFSELGIASDDTSSSPYGLIGLLSNNESRIVGKLYFTIKKDHRENGWGWGGIQATYLIKPIR